MPFAYHGVRDDIDYAHIPWRNRRFDPAALAAAVQTQRRMERLWRAWQAHPGTRTLVFCCSIDHARFAAAWLAEQGVRVASVFAAPGSADRSAAVTQLLRGELDALCVVDIFNEGIDLPALDRVVMLRPTESAVVFLQQLGRGLRRYDGKESLTVIDFVGNHRIFLDRLRRLLSLVSSPTSLRAYLESDAPPELPPGCSVDLELEAKQLLQTFLPRGALEVERVYRELASSRGERPTIGELHRMGYRPRTLRPAHGGWFRFVAHEGHLDADETHILHTLGDWLDELETGAADALALLVLEALLEADALTTGLLLSDLARRCQALLARSPELRPERDTASNSPNVPDPGADLAFWRERATAWTRAHRWFALDADRLVPRRLAPRYGAEPALIRMTRELVDYRLHLHRTRTNRDLAGDAFRCTVTSNQRDPIIKLPSIRRAPDRPSGELDVRLPDGAVWRFRFMREYCNVARPAGTERNRLPDLLRDWFGPNAGHPGTRFEVEFSRSPDGWWIEPISSAPSLSRRGLLVAYPSLRAAAGAAMEGHVDPSREYVSLPFDGPADVFAVRAAGDSMNGGKKPIQDGDWLVMRWARGVSIGTLAGRVALIQTPAGHGHVCVSGQTHRPAGRPLVASL